MTLNKIKNYR